MYKDLISYKLSEEVTEEQLLKVAGQIVNDWMKNLPGFISWEICKDAENNYTDIVCWKSKEDAKNAEKEMANIPNAGDWMACYKPGSISSENVTVLSRY